jgi:hypothetical protein
LQYANPDVNVRVASVSRAHELTGEETEKEAPVRPTAQIHKETLVN